MGTFNIDDSSMMHSSITPAQKLLIKV